MLGGLLGIGQVAPAGQRRVGGVVLLRGSRHRVLADSEFAGEVLGVGDRTKTGAVPQAPVRIGGRGAAAHAAVAAAPLPGLTGRVGLGVGESALAMVAAVKPEPRTRAPPAIPRAIFLLRTCLLLDWWILPGSQ